MSTHQKLDYGPVHDALTRFAASGSLSTEDLDVLRQHQRRRSELRTRLQAIENLKRAEIYSGSRARQLNRPRRPLRRTPKILSCDSGWTGVARLNGGGFDYGSAEGLENQKEIDKLPQVKLDSFTWNGATKVALADPVQGLMSIGTGIGEFGELTYPPTESFGGAEGSIVSASLTKIFVVDNLHILAPNALSVAASLSEPDLYAFGKAYPGDPSTPEGGRVSSWGLAYVDVTLGIAGGNPKTTVLPPEDSATWAASAFDYLWFMTGLPGTQDGGGTTGYELVPFMPIDTAGPDGGLIVKATIPAPWKAATVIMVDVTVELYCYRAKGSNGFSYVDCSTGLVTPPIFDLTPPPYWGMSDTVSSTAPIAVDSVQICGI